MAKNLLVSFLQDSNVLIYLKKHEDVIRDYFSVPVGMSPVGYVVALANQSDENCSSSQYALSPMYCTTVSKCSFCDKKIAVKKTIKVSLYDDVLGTGDIAVLSKYCTSCKVTYYPGFSENYATKKRIYEDNWEKYGVFMSTYSSAFSLDFLERCVCLKLKCHTNFFGRTEAYNMQHKYHKPQKTSKTTSTKRLDKRVLSDSYYKYTLLRFKQRYSMPLTMDIDVSSTFNDELPVLMENFHSRASRHKCAVTGCDSCIVVDGHMKAHRKICLKKGCIEDPIAKSVYCEEHKENVRDVTNNAQVLQNTDEYHIKKIVKVVTMKKRRHYEVEWVGYGGKETTIEPKEHIPRVLTELYDMYGDSTIPTSVIRYFEHSGAEYVVLAVENREDMVLPACSLQIDENAYFIPLPKKKNSCDTEKTKSRFYHRTGGILAMGRPCGYIVGLAEIYGGESIHQVADLMETFLESLEDPSSTKCGLYDDGCHLKRSIDKRSSIYPHLSKIEIKIDRFHFKNHIDEWCKANMNPDDSDYLKHVNTEAMEQVFSWLKGYAPSLRYMNRVNFLFVIMDMIDRHNMEMLF